MKKKTIKTQIRVYNTPKELTKAHQKLLKLANKALKDAYAPYSNFHVGAAILLSNGKMLPGANYENASYPLCLCAERVAIAAAASKYPKARITAIAVTAKKEGVVLDHPISPCGACRQVLVETETKNNQDMEVILRGNSGKIFVLDTGKDLLPLSFEGPFLK